MKVNPLAGLQQLAQDVHAFRQFCRKVFGIEISNRDSSQLDPEGLVLGFERLHWNPQAPDIVIGLEIQHCGDPALMLEHLQILTRRRTRTDVQLSREAVVIHECSWA
jgi:hypothetical protein